MAKAQQADEDKRNTRGRWYSKYDSKGLLVAVRDVALAADADEPDKVSQRKWDAHRGAGGHSDAPSARQICTRLKLAWSEVLRFAFDPDRSLEQTLVGVSKAKERKLTKRETHFALNRVALELNVRTFSKGEYTTAAEKLITVDRRRMGAQSILGELLPTADQIEHAAGSWDDALISAGLDAYDQPTSKGAMPFADAIDLFIDVVDAIPTRNHIYATAAKYGFSVERASKYTAGFVAAHLAARAKAGLHMPTRSLTRDELDALELDATRFAGLTKPQPYKTWTWEKAVRALGEYITSLPANKNPSQHDYGARRKGRAWPSVHTIQDVAVSWSVALAAARILVQTGELVAKDDERLPAQLGTKTPASAKSSSKSSRTTSSKKTPSGPAPRQSRRAA